MGNLFDKLKEGAEELKVGAKAAIGEDTKDVQFSSERIYPDPATAREAFQRSVQKLFDVNRWSKLPGFNSSFTLFNYLGQETSGKPEVGFYMKIILPGPFPENWVNISEIQEETDLASFTVHPSEKPSERNKGEEVIEHFFTKEASSTFRVELNGSTLRAFEIGRDEAANNQGQEAGNRAIVNTLIATGGWAGIQKIQWEKLTDYLVHNLEANQE